jgi:effector-binding domain-containing protein
MDKEKTYIFHTGSGETIEEAYQDAIDELYLHHEEMPENYKEITGGE